MRYRKRNCVSPIVVILAVGVLIGGVIGFFVGKAQAKVVEVEVVKFVNTEHEEPPVEEVEPPQPVSLGVFKTTAYCACKKCCGKWEENRPKDENGNPIVYTATGAIAKEGKTIAVDPSVIPYGTEVIINGHTYMAEDCGGAIKGNRIDIYFESHNAALQHGVQQAEVFVKSEG